MNCAQCEHFRWYFGDSEDKYDCFTYAYCEINGNMKYIDPTVFACDSFSEN